MLTRLDKPTELAFHALKMNLFCWSQPMEKGAVISILLANSFLGYNSLVWSYIKTWIRYSPKKYSANITSEVDFRDYLMELFRSQIHLTSEGVANEI